jgi:hypothetical protein
MYKYLHLWFRNTEAKLSHMRKIKQQDQHINELVVQLLCIYYTIHSFIHTLQRNTAECNVSDLT